MSLSSFLLKSTNNVDKELDNLFKSQPAPPLPLSQSPSKKRKLEHGKQKEQSKRSKADIPEKEDVTPGVKILSKPGKSKPKTKPSNVGDDDGGILDSGGEDAREITSPTEKGMHVEEETDEEEEENSSDLVHESLKEKRKDRPKSGPKQKYAPADETPERRNQRTIFIGNLPLEIVQKRPLQKQLQRHILSFLPTAKVESTRFRSIPFSAPTTKLPGSTEDAAHPHKKNPSQRDHDRERASSWRQQDGDEEAVKNDEKKYLNPNQKKKVAFINQEFHSTADTVHAYLVFAHSVPKESRPTNLPPLPACMDPYEAAKEAVKEVEGTMFLERMLRVDFVGKTATGMNGTDAKEGLALADSDPKLTLFVGNLDLTSTEEKLRVFFEGLMKTERGELSEPGVEDDDDTIKKPKTWVTNVRIVRDKDTQLGKGIAYVQFIDRECVDEILTMDVSQLKFAKRKLRVQRCKTIPGTKLPSSVKLQSHHRKDKATGGEKSRPRVPPLKSTPIIVPKGDPSLGKKIANLSKDQRKEVKAGDADRVARRLAKKKARMSMGTPKDRVADGEKKRERVRKGSGLLLGKKGKDTQKQKKSRVRSEKSLDKRNIKK